MSKHQNGNKEAKKPKQERPPTTNLPPPGSLPGKPPAAPEHLKKK